MKRVMLAAVLALLCAAGVTANGSQENGALENGAADSDGERSEKRMFDDLQYPLLLVDGLARRGDVESLATFDEALEHLRGMGAQVYMNDRDAFGSVEGNADLLADDVDRALEESGAERLHIIAHSKGGLDSRYLISELGYGDRIATLVTIATPHRGTAIADFIDENLDDSEAFFAAAVNWFAAQLGDESPDARAAAQQLTRDYMQGFNRRMPNDARVRYISYAAVITEQYPNPVWGFMARELGDAAGPNDGLVPVSSARWGEFKGVVNELYGCEQVSHRDVVGMNDMWNNMGFPHLRFITDVVQELE